MSEAERLATLLAEIKSLRKSLKAADKVRLWASILIDAKEEGRTIDDLPWDQLKEFVAAYVETRE